MVARKTKRTEPSVKGFFGPQHQVAQAWLIADVWGFVREVERIPLRKEIGPIRVIGYNYCQKIESVNAVLQHATLHLRNSFCLKC